MDKEMKNEILFTIRIIGEKVDNMQNDINEMKKQVAKIPEIEKQVAKIPEMQRQLAEILGTEEKIGIIPAMQKQMHIMQQDIKELKEETRRISRSVAIIENEHGDKLKALFDAVIANTEKLEKQDKKNIFFENKLEKYDDEIYYLSTKVQGL